MRISEWIDAKGISNGLGKVNAKKLYDISVDGCKIKEEDGFRSSLQKSIVQEEAMKEYPARAEEKKRPNGKAPASIEREIGNKNIAIRLEQKDAVKAGKEVPARGIPYSECDMVEINVLEGYVLKAKKEERTEGKEKKNYQVYVEKKSDDGEVAAYLFDGPSSRKDSGDEMERIAYAVMNRNELKG